MANNDNSKILIDTNILFNDFLFRHSKYGNTELNRELSNRKTANDAMTFIRQRRYFKTYVADFSLVKLVSLMDKVKVPKDLSIIEIELVLSKNCVVPMSSKLFAKSINDFKTKKDVKDIEDAFQFTLSQAYKCSFILTLNGKDFKFFDTRVIHPKNIRSII